MHGLAGKGSVPLPRRSKVTDRSVTSIPESRWTPRQREYAMMHGLFGVGGRNAGVPKRGTTPARPARTPVGQTPVTQAPDDPTAAAEEAARDAANADAFAELQETLGQYGLSGLSSFVWEQIVGGKSQAEVLRDIRKTPEFRQRFPAIEAREKAGLTPLSPGEYVAYEKQARQTFRAAGLPEGFYDSNEDFTRFLERDVSMSELADRVALASTAAYNTPADVRRELERFGLRGGDLTAFFLDPAAAQPVLERKYGAARLSANAGRTGFGSLTEGEATDLFQSGVTEAAAQEGFGELAANRELFGSLDLGENVIDRGEQIGAQFKGNAAAQQRIQNRKRRRQSQFEGGGSFATGQGGVVGLGSAPQV